MSTDVDAPASPQGEDRACDTAWFRARTQPVGRHGHGQAPNRTYGNPWVYLTGVAALPLALVLATVDPFGWPRGAYGALIFCAGVPGWTMVQAWAEDRRISAWSRRAGVVQLWLYVGGAVPEAIRAIKHARAR